MSSDSSELTAAELRDEVVRLGPWHIDIEITPEVRTAAFREAPHDAYTGDAAGIAFHDPREGFLRRLYRAFPAGLEGRSVLDCACNCGAYLFYAKEAGAGRCLGFDLREHWIEQARFLARHREQPSDGMRFEAFDLYDLETRDVGRFDVTFFFGIFYHLPDPVRGLKLAADLTDELLVVNTATKAGRPDGLLVAAHESETKLMSGTYGLSWFPTGPLVLAGILKWLGFPEVRCSVWRHAPRQRRDLDRVEVLAARTPGFFSNWDAAVPDSERLAEVLRTRTAPGATTLVLGAGEPLPELRDRRLVAVGDANELERHIAQDAARYVALADEGQAADALLTERLTQSGVVVADEPGCRVYELRGTSDGDPTPV